MKYKCYSHLALWLPTFLILGCFRETGIEVFNVVSTQVTEDSDDLLATDLDAQGRVGDYVLENPGLQIVVNGDFFGPSRNFYLEKSGGAIIDFSSRFRRTGSSEVTSRNDDGLNQLTQGVNMNYRTLINYEEARIEQGDQTKTQLVMKGSVYDMDGSLEAGGASVNPETRRLLDCTVTTTYRLEDLLGEDTETEDDDIPIQFLAMTTVLTNTGVGDLPIFTVNDIAVTTIGSSETFIPYPDWGFDRPGGTAYPPFVQIQPKQHSSAQYAMVSLLDGVLRADHEVVPTLHANITYMGKASAPPTLPGGGQLTFIREFFALNSGNPGSSSVSANSSFLSLSRVLGNYAQTPNIFSRVGNFEIGLVRQSSPGGRVILEYVNESVNYFNGTVYAPLESGRTFPIFGDIVLNSGYGFTSGTSQAPVYHLPVGQIGIRIEALNSQSFSVTQGVNQALTDDDDSTPGPIVIAENADFLFGNLLASDRHTQVSFSLRDPNVRDLMGRLTVDRISGEGPVSMGNFPIQAQDRFYYLSTIGTSTSTNAETLGLPDGDYEILVSRGPRHEVEVQPVSLQETISEEDGSTIPPQPQAFGLDLAEVIPFDGWLNADFDMRSAGDPMGMMTTLRTLQLSYAEDLDVVFMADTNHQSLIEDFFNALAIVLGGFDQNDRDRNLDSLLDEMNVSRTIATIGKVSGPNGDRGRFALLNLPSVDDQVYLQAPVFENGPADFYDRAREISRDILIHVTRPRAPLGLETGFFTAIAALSGLDPNTPVPGNSPFYSESAASGSDTRWIDFDLLQVLSGNAYDEYLLTRQDWFNLLNAGVFKPATGGSYPWQIKDLPVGTVRTWVSVANTELRDNDLSEFWDSARAGNMFVSNGPLIEATVNGASYGGSINVGGDSVRANIKISAAPWIPIREVRAVIDGQVTVLDITLNTEGVVRYEGSVDLTVPAGERHWILFEVGATLDEIAQGEAETGAFGRVYPGHVPIAFTNPIFIN